MKLKSGERVILCEAALVRHFGNAELPRATREPDRWSLRCYRHTRSSILGQAMFKHSRSALSLMVIGIFAASLSACEKQDVASGEKGPAEKAGAQLDQAATRAGEELNKVGEKLGQTMQSAGQKLEDKAQDAQKKE
ncbi:hypothetical protein ACFQUU_26480 [Herbaspirillum sp. GCM10030257]|uniref:hypothetical protein n=1 Tax=Herbaspirillum sp. GCM10030257 TaxID=3273393 RepID=UPI00361F9B5F